MKLNARDIDTKDLITCDAYNQYGMSCTYHLDGHHIATVMSNTSMFGIPSRTIVAIWPIEKPLRKKVRSKLKK